MVVTYRGQTALILGGSCGIGLDLAGLLLAQGLRVVPTYASDRGRQAIADRFPDLTSALHLDLADSSSDDSLAPVLSAGVDYLVDLAQADEEVLLAAASSLRAEAYFQAHISHRLRLITAVTRTMLARRFGRLLHVSSTAAALPAAGQGLYAAAKKAAESLYLSMGLELGTRGVTSLNLRLGLVDAGRGRRFLDSRGRDQDFAARIVSPDQVASTLCFLLSDQALALTCTTITMDAGLTAMKYQ